jgi:hypothetical protein
MSEKYLLVEVSSLAGGALKVVGVNGVVVETL